MSQFISRPTSKPSDGFCFHNEHCSEKHSTEGREESSTIRKSESYRTVESTHLDINGNDIFAQLSFGDNECENIDYNYDDLSVCPKVTSLFKASEAELEHAIFAKSSSDIGISTDDEDDIKTELDRLADVEQQLRDELEMSNMGFSFYLDRNEEAGIVHEATPGTNNNYRGLQGISANDSGGSEGIVKDNTMTEKLAGERIFPLHDDSNVVRKQPEQPNKTTNTNIKTKQEEEGSNQQTHKGSGSNYKIYTLYDHADQIGLIYDDSDLGYPTCPLFSSDSGIIHDSNLGNSGDERTREDKIVEFLKCARDYVKPMTSASLSRIYVGLVGDNHSCTIANEKDDIAAVRTVAIQIRPDASVDEVMSTFNSSLKSMNGTVTNLQMGHLRALLPGRWVQESEYVPFRTTQKKADVTISSRRGMVFLPPIAIDAQLCTRKKSTFVERVLLIRSYSIQLPILDDGCSSLTPVNNSQNSNLRESASLHQRMRKVATVGGNISFNFKGDLEEDNNFMVDNCTLDTRKRRVKSHKRFGFLHQASHKNESDVSQKRSQKRKPVSVRFDTCGSIESVRGQNDPKTLASEQLLSTFTDSPSILDSANDVDASIPALSHLDWPYIQSTWRILIASMTELEKRGLSQSSLLSSPFGTFPSHPTLDIHYCSQVKEICKENMIAKLFKLSNELEAYAKEVEYGCETLKQVLEPMAFSYNEDLPKLPETILLSEYQLDFIAPEILSPPWGQRVGEALRSITTKSPSLQISTFAGVGYIDEVQRAREAASIVFSAFWMQFDEELSARLARRNHYVMDRLAKSQLYMAESIAVIRGSYDVNHIATKAAHKFHAYANDCAQADLNSNVDSQLRTKILPASDQVPLLSCRVIVGGLGAMCYVTYHQLLLVSKRMPMVRGNRFHLVLLQDIEVEVKISSSKSRLNLLPSMVVVKNKNNGNELLSFRPATGAHLFKDFVDTVKKYGQSPDTVSFSPMLKLIAEHSDE